MPNWDPEKRSNWVSDRREENPLNRLGAMLTGQVNDFKKMWQNSIAADLIGYKPQEPPISTSGVMPGGPESQMAKALGIDDIGIGQYDRIMKRMNEDVAK